MNKKYKKTILVTGGAGFIGSHLCERLIKDGHKVICVDSFFSGKKANIQHLLSNKNFVLIKHNIIYPLNYKFKKIDEIYNLACPASPIQYQFDPILTTRTSVDGTRNMLDLAVRYQAKMLQASTSEIYGDPLEHPQREEYFGNVNPIGKRSCYDEGKRVAESICKDYSLEFKVDVRIARLFNVYGPKMMFNDGRVISNFILQALLNEDITVHGSGMQSRSFMYVDDLIEGFLKFMDAKKEEVGIGPINLGNPDQRTILSLAKDIKSITNSKSKIIFVDYEKIPGRLGDPQQRCPDISKAENYINWQPEINFQEGIRKTIQDFKDRLNNKSKIAIFIPTYLPFEGPVEKIIKHLADKLSEYQFDIFTSKLSRSVPYKETLGKVNVYRVGIGTKIDKYLLSIVAPFKVLSLHKKKSYEAAWGIMASYGSLAAVIFSYISRVALLISLYEGKIGQKNNLRKKVLNPIYRMIFRRAHHIQIIAPLSPMQIAWAKDEQNIKPVDIDKGYEYLIKRVREELQELEILTSRL